MRHLVRLYDRLIVALAAVAGAMLAGVFVMIVYDVTVRALGYQPPAHTSALSEYAMLYMTLLAAPWVLRKKGHVFVEFLAGALPGGVRRGLRRSIYVLC
ncbi:MAG: TRAP transporter small permease subunit, partial [Rhodospirillaceae bacterium]|nr:TRAP transporter small permease subunit [Rhodospirillaceae bacterium]